MHTRKVLTLASMVAMLFAPVTFCAAGVLGEKLDSGLGDLPASYTAAEFQPNVVGQKLDSGLGELPSTYMAAEFQPTTAQSGYRVIGESLDSGLGDLPASYTASEYQKHTVAKL